MISVCLLLIFAAAAPIEEFTGKIVAITDGDTIRVLRDGKEVRVRLEGIDCPEANQAFGTKAKQATSDLAFDKTVTVRVKGVDKYGRLLADVILPDGSILNRELVRSGYAWWFRKYSSDESLGKLEAEARAAKLGLWAEMNPIPPWDWRRGQAAASLKVEEPKPIEPNGVEIVALLPNPSGTDEGNEEVTLMNSSDKQIDLNGWLLRDRAGNHFRLSGRLEAKAQSVIKMKNGAMPLNNDGDDVFLLDGNGIVRSKASYSGRETIEGRVIEFKR